MFAGALLLLLISSIKVDTDSAHNKKKVIGSKLASRSKGIAWSWHSAKHTNSKRRAIF